MTMSASAPVDERHRFGYWSAAATYLAMQAFSTVPSPLYGRYAERDHLSSLMITLVYAAYAAGVSASLVLAGHLSDTLGRRPVLITALGLNCASAVVFLAAPSLPGLFAARIVCGLAVGVTASTATAYLNELFLARRSADQLHRVQFLATATSIGGLGVGGLLGGAIAQEIGHPFVVPYLVMLAVFAACALAVFCSPETRPRVRPRPAYHPQRVTVPDDARSRYAAALTGVAAVFSLFGLFVGLAGTVLGRTLHETSLLVSGGVLFVLFEVGVLCAAVTSRLGHRSLARTAGALILLGSCLLVLSVWLPEPSLAVFVVAAAVIGAGGSALFRASLTVATSLAPAQHLAETLAGFFLAGYLGLSVPVIGIGFALQHFSVRVTLLGFAVVIVAGVMSALPRLARARATTG